MSGIHRWSFVFAFLFALAPAMAYGNNEMTEGWLFLGRLSGKAWKPASPSIANPRYPVKSGSRVVVKRDALVYGPGDCKVIDAAEFEVEQVTGTVLLVKADRKGLEIVGSPLECPSIGRAKTVWVQVEIPADRLLSVER